MRPDEISMAESLSRHFGVGFLAGEDPPDIYLTFDGGNIAVEISTLAQLVDDGTGKLKPRLSDEMPAVRLTNELDSEMKNRIPDGRHFLLILGSPLRDPRKTKEATHQLLSEMLTLPVEDIIDREATLSGNRIQVTLFTDGRRTKKKVVAAISNQRVGYDVYQVTKDML